MAHGILPAALSHGGLRDAVDDFVERLDFPVAATVTEARLAPEIEANAYFIVAEALTNVVKHARATRAEVRATVQDDTLIVEIRDDGVGGGDPRAAACSASPTGRRRWTGACGSRARPGRAPS